MSTKHDITGLYTTLCNSPFKLKDELCGENSALLNLSMILLFALGLRVGGNWNIYEDSFEEQSTA